MYSWGGTGIAPQFFLQLRGLLAEPRAAISLPIAAA